MELRVGGKIFLVWARAVAVCGVLLQTAMTGMAAESPFEQANRLYEQGKYSEAAALYENVIKGGRQSAPVFFNLGNAYFKDGKTGRAIYHYRIAERLKPRDPDIQANLRFSRERVPDSASRPPTLWKRALGYFTLNELGLAFTLTFWIWATVFSLGRVRPAVAPKLRPFAIGTAVLAALTLTWLVTAHSVDRQQVAISISPQGKAHLGPLAESQVAFPAPDGSELEVIGVRGDWIQVIDRNGRSGWMAKNEVLVFPPPQMQ